MLMTFGQKKIYTEGINLCSCDVPCAWSVKWIKSIGEVDKSLYHNLKSPHTKTSILIQIQKDVKRTQPSSKSFQNFQNKKILQ